MTTTTGITVHDQNLEKQIEKHMGGCMAGFFNLFDRSHLLSGKRLYPKRLPPSLTPSMVGDSASESISAVGSPPPSTELEKPAKPQPEHRSPSPAAPPAKSPWKFNKEAPRLSLDSRAITDAKGGLRPREIRINTAATAADDAKENQRQSPSVIARLMGLEQLPSSANEPEKNVELRRSASESRSREYRFFDTPSFLSPVTTKNENVGERKSDQNPGINRNHHINNNSNNKNNNVQKLRNQSVNNNSNNNQRRMMVERRSYYDTADFFPPEVAVKQQQQQQNQAVTIYGEIERRLKMRGIDEPSKDLETLKHILEALQLKGLLHSSTSATDPHHNRRFTHDEERESPVVLMKPARSPASNNNNNNRRRNANLNNSSSSGESPRRERAPRSPMRSPGRNDNRNSSPAVRRKGCPLSVETQRRSNDTITAMSSSSRVSQSPVHSPKSTTTTTVIRRSDQTVNRSPRNRKSTEEISQGERIHSGPAFAEDEASTTISESSFSTSSHTDNERWRGEEYKDGRNLLERCDKLLNSIAEITANNSNSNSSLTELQQPSPVSVLDSSFYKEDESSPSPVKKRTIDFKDQVVMELEDELLWSPSSTIQLSKLDHDLDSSDDSEFSYVSEVLRASNYLPDDSNLFLLLEKQTSIRGNKDKSKASILQRKLIFDTITEILDRNQQLPPWKTVSISNSTSTSLKPTLEQIWSEFQKIRERGPSEDLYEVICGVLKKDLAEDSINGWADSHMEVSEAVLDIERMIFKDLIGETIRDLASLAGKSAGLQASRRKLVF